MITVEKTRNFDRWFRKIKDAQAKAKILFRIQKIQFDGHFGDCMSVGKGISENQNPLCQGLQGVFWSKK